MTSDGTIGAEHTSYVDLGDVTLFVRELGRRRPDRSSLLLLHGGPDVGHSYLLPGVRPLAVDHHVVLFDFRGCGRSSRNLAPDDLQPEYVINDAHRLIAELGLGPVDLLGFSTGGRAAIRYLQEYPADVGKIILASTSAYDGSASRPYLEHWDEYHRRERIEQEAGGRLRNSTVFVWDLDLAPGYLEMIKDLDEGDWSYQRYLDGRMHPWLIEDAEETLRRAGRPALILHGDKDMGFPVQLAHRLHRAVPDSVLKIIPDAAHMCQYEKPDLWADHIHHFLISG